MAKSYENRIAQTGLVILGRQSIPTITGPRTAIKISEFILTIDMADISMICTPEDTRD